MTNNCGNYKNRGHRKFVKQANQLICIHCGTIKKCKRCGDLLNTAREQKCKACIATMSRLHKKKYNKSDKGRAAQKRQYFTQKYKDRQKRYRQSEKGRRTIRAWFTSPRGKEASLRCHHKRRMQTNKIISFTENDWAKILYSWNHACVYCGKDDLPLTRDHIIPLAKGGLHIKENIVPACRPCNAKKGARILPFTQYGIQLLFPRMVSLNPKILEMFPPAQGQPTQTHLVLPMLVPKMLSEFEDAIRSESVKGETEK